MNQLYPLKFKPIIKDKIWGGTRLRNKLNKKCKTDKAGESWEISGYPGDISRVKNGFLSGNSLEELIEVYMGDLVGDHVFEKFGTLFPLLIKFIDANDDLSIQVHPNDAQARELFGSFGKTEMWYVLHAEKDSDIIVGFNKPVTPDEYQFHLENRTLMSIMNAEKAAPGDVFFLPPGRIHAIGKGILLAEIQQTSDATLRIYDFDRLDDKGKPRELHTEQALKTIDFSPVREFRTPYAVDPGKSVNLATCPYFTTNLIHLNGPLERNYQDIDSFVIYLCVQGKASLTYRGNSIETLEQGETVLLPAEIKKVTLTPEGDTRILEVYIEGTGDRNLDELLDQLL